MAKIDELLETIDTLTVVELAELVKGIEEKYGVSAAAVADSGCPAGLCPRHGHRQFRRRYR